MLQEDDYITLDETGVIKTPGISFEPNPNGLGDELFRAMNEHSEKTAQIRAPDGLSQTYSQLLKNCVRTALEMKERVNSNDVVCLCSYNHLDSCVPFVACAFLGVKVASLDPSQSVNDVSHLLTIVKPKLTFVVPEAVGLVSSAVQKDGLETELVVFGETTEYIPFRVFLEEKEGEDEFRPVKACSEDTVAIFFSSGTTGYPKGICISHYALVMQGTAAVKSGLVSSVVLLYSSLYWISAALFLTASTIAGATRIICSNFDPRKIWQYIDNYKVTMIFLAPILAVEMCHEDRPEGVDTTSLLEVMTGGGPLSTKYVYQLRDLLPGANIAQCYGQTEIAGAITSFNSRRRKDVLLAYHKPSSCGRPIRGVWYKIVDPETEQTLTFNQRGEIRLKTKCQMNGYYNTDSSDCWDEDGFIKTGDIAYFDEDFCFYIVDRIKELLKYKSWHVLPSVLEHLLLQHPAVKEAIVLGIPHETDGDHPLGLVVLKKNAGNITGEELERFVEERVDERQRLRAGVKIVEKLYYTPTGKVMRRHIRDLVMAKKI